jgi:thiamine kinase-like enzyme
MTLCRVDANIRNFIRRPGLWASVDWENSGWGDPAFEIADLITHAAYIDVPAWRWEWLTDTYCTLVNHSDAAIRIRAYRKAMLVWWVARLARALVEIPQGRDVRLAPRSPNWEAEMHAKVEHYLSLAEAVDWDHRE